MSAHDAEKRRPAERCHPSCFLCWRLRPSRLTSSEGKRKTCRGAKPGYSPGFFPLPSCGEASSALEGAIVTSLRPLACDFRRLRFSRNASFSRSCLGFFAGSLVWPSYLSFSSFIVNLLV